MYRLFKYRSYQYIHILSQPYYLSVCACPMVFYHCYADDTQAYLVFKPDKDWQNTTSRIEICIEEIKMWMSVNMLWLNQDKMEFIVFSSKCTVHDSPSYHLKFGDTFFSEAPSVKNKTLCVQKQISSVSCACYYQLIINLSGIKTFTSTKS